MQQQKSIDLQISKKAQIVVVTLKGERRGTQLTQRISVGYVCYYCLTNGDQIRQVDSCVERSIIKDAAMPQPKGWETTTQIFGPIRTYHAI